MSGCHRDRSNTTISMVDVYEGARVGREWVCVLVFSEFNFDTLR